MARKHNTLKQCQCNSYATPSHDTVEKDSLQDLTVKRSISWDKMNNECWSTIGSVVQAQLHLYNTLSVTIKFPEVAIYSEASKIFGHLC